jgi:pilus assembly protein CpaE
MIRVLIADDSVQVSDNLARRLGLEDDLEVCGTARDGESAVQDALRLRPDIAVIDAALPGMDGGQTTEMLAQCLPGTGVIMMSMEAENDAYRLAMLAGAREFLQKPFKGDDLVAAVRRVHAFEQRRAVVAVPATAPPPQAAPPPPAPATRGQVTAVIAGKGGVGKTVVAVNLAATLGATHPGRVVLVDLSLQFGDVGAALNLPAARTLTDLLVDNHAADPEVVRGVLVDGPAGISVLLAPTTPEVADYITAAHLRSIIEGLRTDFDHIIVDTSSYLTEVGITTLDLVDTVLLVTDLSVTGVKNARLARGILETLRVDPARIMVIANHRDGAGELDVSGAESFLGARISTEIPYDAGVVATSVNEGIPFVISRPGTLPSAALRAIAKTVDPALRIGGDAPQAPRSSAKKNWSRRVLGFSR